MNIWFNRTFSTASHYVEMIRHNPDNKPFKIFATHPSPHSIMLQAADYAELEPAVPAHEYAAYCVDFCARHKIDIFIPHYRLAEVAKHRDEFDRIGTKVMLAGTAEMLSGVDDKGRLFEVLSGVPGLQLPDYDVVTTLEEFEKAYKLLTGKGRMVCLKPVSGEGGAGFRIITDEPNTIQSLYEWAGATMHIEEVVRLLGSESSFPPLMVMEYLEGSEYSVDCLGSAEGIIAAVPRKKVEGRVRLLEHNEALIRLAHEIHRVLPLQYNFNIQFIYQGDTPKLLEINPRTSGGLYTTCLSGVNFPYLAVKLLLEEAFETPAPEFGIYATHLEQEYVIKRPF
ncbi:ATP-grasp domain-containing protein [Paenibacillus macerans]|uniref:ATP-grasp domain-containing protein n=1 Tax=Paenibacillus macerans TaxID=44252 RepID=UPI00203F7F1D|nr:ATP-grasp domain-containing protein [Paenibacillus macerans]MCM3701973.1 ATP-grasp domain-containing protein [Paenibacillus macerans]